MFKENALRAAMLLANVSMDDLAGALGIHKTTLYRKIEDGGRFSRKEINIIINLCGIEDPKPIFFSD